MSYELSYDSPVSLAPADARAAFIRRTYGHLAGAILAFIALESVLLNLPGMDGLIRSVFATRMSWYAVFFGFIAVGWLAERWARSDTSPTVQYFGLGLYVVAESVIFLPLLYIAKTFYTDVIPVAGILTLSVFGGLTAAVFITRKDFSYLGPIISIGSFLALGFIIAGMFVGFSGFTSLLFCFAMVALLCGCILYQTSNVIHYYRTDQHVAAALGLFASVATLFWYILQIVMSSRK